jgi:hypothetical protein
MGGFDHWSGSLPREVRLNGGWLVQCGTGRFKAEDCNAAFSLRTGAALNYRIAGVDQNDTSFEFCVAWDDG